MPGEDSIAVAPYAVNPLESVEISLDANESFVHPTFTKTIGLIEPSPERNGECRIETRMVIAY
jgi:hypothetical protein